MILYLEFGVVVTMLLHTVYELIKVIIWEIQDAVEEWRDINYEDVDG